MLQRLVRSTVRTAPRPYFTVLDPLVMQLFVVVRINVATPEHLLISQNLTSIAIMSSSDHESDNP